MNISLEYLHNAGIRPLEVQGTLEGSPYPRNTASRSVVTRALGTIPNNRPFNDPQRFIKVYQNSGLTALSFLGMALLTTRQTVGPVVLAYGTAWLIFTYLADGILIQDLGV
jgi:hypothetical protein